MRTLVNMWLCIYIYHVYTFRFRYCIKKWYILVIYKPSLGISSPFITWDSNHLTSFKIPCPATFLRWWWHICWHRHLLCTAWDLENWISKDFGFPMSLQIQPISSQKKTRLPSPPSGRLVGHCCFASPWWWESPSHSFEPMLEWGRRDDWNLAVFQNVSGDIVSWGVIPISARLFKPCWFFGYWHFSLGATKRDKPPRRCCTCFIANPSR